MRTKKRINELESRIRKLEDTVGYNEQFEIPKLHLVKRMITTLLEYLDVTYTEEPAAPGRIGEPYILGKFPWEKNK